MAIATFTDHENGLRADVMQRSTNPTHPPTETYYTVVLFDLGADMEVGRREFAAKLDEAITYAKWCAGVEPIPFPVWAPVA